MIPSLLHGRILGAQVPPGIVAAPAYSQVLGFAVDRYSAEVTCQFSMNPDGTWSTVEPYYADESGVWFYPLAAGVGSNFDVRILMERLPYTEPGVTDTAGVVVNEAWDWIPLSVARVISVKVQRFTQGRSIAVYRSTVQIRQSGGGPILSVGQFQIGSQVQVNSNLSGGGGGGGGGGPIEQPV